MDEEPVPSSTASISAEDEAILAGFLERRGLKPSKASIPRPKQKMSPTRKQRRERPEDKT
jgi:hypothetical protein